MAVIIVIAMNYCLAYLYDMFSTYKNWYGTDIWIGDRSKYRFQITTSLQSLMRELEDSYYLIKSVPVVHRSRRIGSVEGFCNRKKESSLTTKNKVLKI